MYLLATAGDKVRWYSFVRGADGEFTYQLHDELDLKVCEGFASKEEGNRVARLAGLKTWRYFRF